MSTATENTIPRPDPTKMYGLLHDLDGNAIETEVRSLKVGIGVPSGKDLHVWIDYSGKWVIEVGVYDGNGKRVNPKYMHASNMDEAYDLYLEARRTAPQRKYPRKIPYFTFLRMEVDGDFWHDFEAIEKHGPMPAEIDVVFMKDYPLDHSFQWWTAAALQCEGDGKVARRLLSLAKTDQEKQLAKEAAARHDRYFPIIEGCFTYGCGYAKGDKPVCKPHGRLYHQLVHSPAIGGSCTFDTTGFRSIKQLFSCMRQIRRMTGHGDPEAGAIAGIPLKMVLRPYRVAPGGKVGTQYGVSLEFRAGDAVGLVKELQERAAEFRAAASLQLGPGGPLQLGPAFPDEDDIDESADAAALNAEFYGSFEQQQEEDKGPTENPFKPQARPSTTNPPSNEGTKPEVVPEKSANGQPSVPVEPAKGKGPRSHAKAAPVAETPAKPAPVSTTDDRDDWIPEELGGKADPEKTTVMPSAAVKEALAEAKAGPQLVKDAPKPSQNETLNTLIGELQKLGNYERPSVQQILKRWIMAFTNIPAWKNCPQPAYDVPLEFLEREVRRDGLAILQDAHGAGLVSGSGWNELVRFLDKQKYEEPLKSIVKRAALAHASDNPGMLIDLFKAAQEDGPLPDQELEALFTVYCISPASTVPFQEKATHDGITMEDLLAKIPDVSKANEADILTLIAGGK